MQSLSSWVNTRGVGHSNSFSNLSILYFNARSLLPKFDELVILCEIHKPGIVCIVESWLSEDIEDSELKIPDYQVLRLDRNRHGGGILIFVHNSLTYNVISKGPSNLELMLISVGQHKSSSKFCIGIFYRSVSGPFKQVISFAHSSKEIFSHPRWVFSLWHCTFRNTPFHYFHETVFPVS